LKKKKKKRRRRDTRRRMKRKRNICPYYGWWWRWMRYSLSHSLPLFSKSQSPLPSLERQLRCCPLASSSPRLQPQLLQHQYSLLSQNLQPSLLQPPIEFDGEKQKITHTHQVMDCGCRQLSKSESAVSVSGSSRRSQQTETGNKVFFLCCFSSINYYY